MYTVHGVEEIPTKILHTFGVEQPESPGLCGGYPSTTNQFAIVRDSDVLDRFAGGEVPQRLEELAGRLEAYGAYAVTSLRRGDVYRAVSMGGGGYGDPLDRDPERVARDVERSLVTREWAERTWGVVLTESGTVDEDATAASRERLRAARREAAKAAGAETLDGVVRPWSPESQGVRLSEALYYDTGQRPPAYRCRCGQTLGSADLPYKELAAQARYPVQHIGPEVNPARIGGDRFELREFYCPGCFTLLEVEIARPSDPLLDDARLALVP
jgi:N-methylhydantoinase B